MRNIKDLNYVVPILGVATITMFAIVFKTPAQTVTSPTPMIVILSTVAGVPTCNAAAEGLMRGVTDALAPVSLAVAAGGGAVHVKVYCNGSQWIVQ